MIHSRYYTELDKYNQLIKKKNKKSGFYNVLLTGMKIRY